MLAEDTLLTESEILKLLSASKELKKGRPLQYISGRSEFLGLDLKTDERALIPRPETEELVKWVIDSHEQLKRILDIGTGTGCIALALKEHYAHADIHAIDHHREAISLALENSESTGLKIQLHKDDILAPSDVYGKFDLIISNPPYVLDSQKQYMRGNILDHEPHTALFVPNDDALKFYRAILLFSKKHLNTMAWLYFEINEDLVEQMRELITKFGYTEIEIKKDLNGKDRMMRAKLQS